MKIRWFCLILLSLTISLTPRLLFSLEGPVHQAVETAVLEHKTSLARNNHQSMVFAIKDLASNLRSIYSNYRQRISPLDQLLISYLMALGSRYDRREISKEEFWSLLERMIDGINQERRKLTAEQGNAAEARETQKPSYVRNSHRHEEPAARQQAWRQASYNYWVNWERSYELKMRNPIRCQAMDSNNGIALVRCQ